MRYLILWVSVLPALLTLSLTRTESVQAQRVSQVNVYDLVNAVNALRAAYGLPAYGISPILMFTAQNQADFMAATGDVTHSGPGGISLTDRLLAAGYPLAGDLSLGGFRAENITSGGEGMSAQAAIDRWMGDAPHQNTMLSPDLTEIGAGVAFANERVYLVIDCARSTDSGVFPAGTPVVESGATVPEREAVIYPVILSTPNESGQVIHEVLSGQTLWQIAISYNVKIDDIKRLNNFSGNDIYPGEQLLIKIEAISTAESSTVTPLSQATATLLSVMFTATQPPTLAVAMTQTPQASAAPMPAQNNTQALTVVVAIMTVAILGGGIFAGLARKKSDKTG